MKIVLIFICFLASFSIKASHTYQPLPHKDVLNFSTDPEGFSSISCSSFPTLKSGFFNYADTIAALEARSGYATESPINSCMLCIEGDFCVMRSMWHRTYEETQYSRYKSADERMTLSHPKISFCSTYRDHWVIFGCPQIVLSNPHDESSYIHITPFHSTIPYIGLKGSVNWTYDQSWPFEENFEVCNGVVTISCIDRR